MDCVESTIQLKSMGLQKIVQTLAGFGLDRVVIPDRLQLDVNSGTILRVIRGFPQDFVAILSNFLQSFAVLQSCRNPIGLNRIAN